MRLISEISLAILIAGTACGSESGPLTPVIKGSGVVKEETRDVAGFTGIEATAAFSVIVKIGPKPSLTLNAEDNLLPLISTKVRDGKLAISWSGNFNIQPTRPQVVTIVATSLDQIVASEASNVLATIDVGKSLKAMAKGASKIDLGGIDVETIELTVVGASEIKLEGKGKTMRVDVAGASTCKAGTATFESVVATVSGASQGEIFASRSVAGSANGASSLKVLGQPTSRQVTTSGASTVSY